MVQFKFMMRHKKKKKKNERKKKNPIPQEMPTSSTTNSPNVAPANSATSPNKPSSSKGPRLSISNTPSPTLNSPRANIESQGNSRTPVNPPSVRPAPEIVRPPPAIPTKSISNFNTAPDDNLSSFTISIESTHDIPALFRNRARLLLFALKNPSPAARLKIRDVLHSLPTLEFATTPLDKIFEIISYYAVERVLLYDFNRIFRSSGNDGVPESAFDAYCFSFLADWSFGYDAISPQERIKTSEKTSKVPDILLRRDGKVHVLEFAVNGRDEMRHFENILATVKSLLAQKEAVGEIHYIDFYSFRLDACENAHDMDSMSEEIALAEIQGRETRLHTERIQAMKNQKASAEKPYEPFQSEDENVARSVRAGCDYLSSKGVAFSARRLNFNEYGVISASLCIVNRADKVSFALPKPRCLGFAKKDRCKNPPEKGKKYCHHHVNQAPKD